MGAIVQGWEEAIERRPRHRWKSDGHLQPDDDALVVEEPLEIRFGNMPLAVVMRTPGHDIELATGFAITELILRAKDELLRIAPCSDGEHGDNVIRIIPTDRATFDPSKFQRNLFTTSSCGVCGKRSIEQAMREAPSLDASIAFDGSVLAALTGGLRKSQPVFQQTGALHAAALVDRDGQIQCLREDIGRHNAVDKVVGWSVRREASLKDTALLVSGRASYEIVQKALAARISCVVAVGGVSSLAVDLAERAGICLVGFARAGSLSVYTHPERIR